MLLCVQTFFSILGININTAFQLLSMSIKEFFSNGQVSTEDYQVFCCCKSGCHVKCASIQIRKRVLGEVPELMNHSVVILLWIIYEAGYSPIQKIQRYILSLIISQCGDSTYSIYFYIHIHIVYMNCSFERTHKIAILFACFSVIKTL